jgi:hypothetical protein
MPKRRTPFDEIAASLNADPEWDAARAAEQAERDQRTAELRRAGRPLVEDLRAAGFSVDSVWDFVNTSKPYPKALPILLEHLERAYPGEIRSGIARSLAVPDARHAWHIFERLYKAETDKSARSGLAAALSATAT